MKIFHRTILFFLFMTTICFSQESRKIFLSISKEFSSKTDISILYIGPENTYFSDFLKTLKTDFNYSGYFTVHTLYSTENFNISDMENLIKKNEFVCVIKVINKKEIDVQWIDAGNSERFKNRYSLLPFSSDTAHMVCDDIVYWFTGKKSIAKTKIAYVSNVAGTPQIFIIDYDGNNKIQITNSPHIKDFPRFSPEHKLIYISYKSGTPTPVLFDANRGQEIPIFSFPGLTVFADISPIGPEMAIISSKDGNPEIYIASFNGEILNRLTYSSSIETSPSFSSDGDYIAFTSDRSGKPQVYIMDKNGNNVKKISYGYDYAISPAWSPDGKYICYLVRKQGVFQMVLYDVLAKKNTLLPTKTGWAESVSWAPDSRHMVFAKKQN